MKDKEMALAALKGLKKYPGLGGDTKGNHADLYPDKLSGLYTHYASQTVKRRGSRELSTTFRSTVNSHQ